MLPFEKVRLHGADGVRQNLTACKMGQYTRITNAFMQMANSGLDLRTCTVDELETVHGVGMKSARFFLMHTRPNQQFAVLDTHILKHLKEMGYDVPKRTPTVPSMYRKVEGYFMELVAKSGLTIAEYDLMIWTQKRQNVA
jgi:thermostable 8-oxoguanine DNA glycosylase